MNSIKANEETRSVQVRETRWCLHFEICDADKTSTDAPIEPRVYAESKMLKCSPADINANYFCYTMKCHGSFSKPAVKYID